MLTHLIFMNIALPIMIATQLIVVPSKFLIWPLMSIQILGWVVLIYWLQNYIRFKNIFGKKDADKN